MGGRLPHQIPPPLTSSCHLLVGTWLLLRPWVLLPAALAAFLGRHFGTPLAHTVVGPIRSGQMHLGAQASMATE